MLSPPQESRAPPRVPGEDKHSKCSPCALLLPALGAGHEATCAVCPCCPTCAVCPCCPACVPQPHCSTPRLLAGAIEKSLARCMPCSAGTETSLSYQQCSAQSQSSSTPAAGMKTLPQPKQVYPGAGGAVGFSRVVPFRLSTIPWKTEWKAFGCQSSTRYALSFPLLSPIFVKTTFPGHFGKQNM